MKKIISFLLVIVMIIPIIQISAFAEESDTISTTDTTNTTIESDTGLGGLIANSLEEQEGSEEDPDIQNKILEVAVNGTTATVTFNNAVECKIIVAIYDENTNVMVGSGMESFAENTQSADIEIDVETMPEYFIVKAYLLDQKNSPLHTSYESKDYTQAHQEFLATTVDDFEEEEVINYDKDETNNFAVLKDSTIQIEGTDEINTLLSADESTRTYIFTNADETLLNLVCDDKLYYTYGDVVIATVVESIEIENDTVTIIGNADTALDDIFEFVKIDTSLTSDGATVDMSNTGEGVEYLGEFETPAPFGILGDHEDSASFAHKWALSKTFYSTGEGTDQSFKVNLTGELSFKAEAKFKAHIYFDYCSVEFSVSEESAFEISLEGKLSSKQFDVAEFSIPVGIADLKVGVDLDFVVEASASIKFTATEKSVTGMRFDTRVGRVEDISVPSQLDTDLEFEGKVFAGIKAEPKAKFLGNVVEVKLSFKAGVEFKAASVSVLDTDTVKHTCLTCCDGEVNSVFSVGVGFSIKAKLGKFELFDFSGELELCSVKKKLLDLYRSNGLWYIGNCPNYAYKQNIYVVDINKNPISGAKVGNLTTDSNGMTSSFFPNGQYPLSVSKSSYTTQQYNLLVREQPGDHIVTLYLTGQISGNTWNNSDLGNLIYKGNNEGTTKVYYYDEKGRGSSANIYAYTYRSLPAAGVEEALGQWPGVRCKYESANIWSVNIPNACTHVLFSYGGDTSIEGQTNDIPNPGRTMIAVRGSGYEINGVGGKHPIYVWEEYGGGNILSIDDATDETETETESATPDEVEPVVVEESITVNDLVPDGIYAFMMLKGGVDNYTVDTESLMYITDGVADKNGDLTFTYNYEQTDDQWVCAIFGPCNHAVGNWTTVTNPTVTETGLKAQFCTKCSEVINTEIIPTINITGISLYNTPYLVTGDEESINNIILSVSLDNGETISVQGTSCTISGYDCNVAGKQTISVTYCGFTADITVDVVDIEEAYIKVYFENSNYWSKVNAYVWLDSGNKPLGEWPGTPCTNVEGNIWCIEVPAISENIIFNSGSGDQTDDLIIPGDGHIYKGMSTWAKYSDLLGDVNMDGVVSIMDATYIQLHISRISTFDTLQLTVADVSKDGYVSIFDATMIQLYLAMIIESL